MDRMQRRFQEQLGALVEGIEPSDAHGREDGTTLKTWAGFSAGVSQGSGSETHTVKILLDSKDGLYSASYSCRRSSRARRTGAITRSAPTCKRCLASRKD